MVLVCKWKTCKKIRKDGPGEDSILACSNPKCDNQMHQACFDDLVSVFCDGEKFPSPVCGKRCLNAMRKAAKMVMEVPTTTKKRIAWHNDGPTPSISSVSCLLDWMTTGTNYERYRGGDAQSGDTKSSIAGEILQFIADAGVTTPRCVKDIMTKISSLETTYKTAADWLGVTGQGVEEGKQLQDAILSRCPYYYQLDDIMKDRASTTPLMLNTESLNYGSESDDEEESSDDTLCGDASSGGIASDMTSTSPDAYAISKNPTSSTTTTTAAHQPVTPVPTGVKKLITLETSKPGSDRKRPASTPQSVESAAKKTKDDTMDLVASYPLTELKKIQLAQDKEFQLQSLRIKRDKAASLAEETRAKVEEAAARTLHYRAQAESCLLNRNVCLLRERNKLREEGVPQCEINFMLPLLPADLEEVVE